MRKRPPLSHWLSPNVFKEPKTKRAKPTHYESKHQCNVMNTLYHEYREVWEVTFAIPNGGGRSAFEASFMKEEGVKPGVPDIFSAWPSGIYHGLFIEMKRLPSEGKGKPVVSKEQKEWHIKLRNMGYAVYVCYGYEEAMKTIRTYLNLDCYRGQVKIDI